MKRILTLSLAAVMLMAALVGCAPKTDGDANKDLTAEERAALYSSAITDARGTEDNEYLPVITDPDDEAASMLLDVLGLTAEDMAVFAIATSAMNVQAYGVAAVYPAADKSDAVMEALQGFIDRQKQNFEMYLVDQFEIASAAKLEKLTDGTILLVMCEGQDEVFASIKTAIEGGK